MVVKINAFADVVDLVVLVAPTWQSPVSPTTRLDKLTDIS